MKRKLTCCLVAAIVAVAFGCAHAKKQTFRVPGGVPINPLGLSIDASYDERLDDLVPGYKVVNVAMINKGFRIVYLNPEKDRWYIKLANSSKAIKAVHDLRSSDPEAWRQIPEDARNLMGYPLVLPIGAQHVVDIFVPDSVDVAMFNELDVYLKSMDAKIEILVRQ